MQGSAASPVVPMGRMSMGNALNGHPRRRAPLGGTKLNAKGEERKKPSLKDIFGVTPVDLLGSVSTDELPTPVKLLRKFIGTSSADSTDSHPEEYQQDEQKPLEGEQSCAQQQDSLRRHAPFAHQPLLEDTRTNLEKYMNMKMQGTRSRIQPCAMSCPPPSYYAPNAYAYQGPAPFTIPSSLPSGVQGYWGSQGTLSQYDSECSHPDTAGYQQQSSIDPPPHGESAVGSLDASLQFVPEGLQLQAPPAWFQQKSYMPQVPQFSHMSAPVPGAPFHPGFSYATDFKYYYNYYSADQYTGELDGGSATAQEEAVAREQSRAEELVERQATQPQAQASSLKPIITSKKRLESGKAVAL